MLPAASVKKSIAFFRQRFCHPCEILNNGLNIHIVSIFLFIYIYIYIYIYIIILLHGPFEKLYDTWSNVPLPLYIIPIHIRLVNITQKKMVHHNSFIIITIIREVDVMCPNLRNNTIFRLICTWMTFALLIQFPNFLWNANYVPFANGPGDLGSIPGRIIPKTSKMVLDTSLLNTQQYKVRIKGKVGQSRERSSAILYTSV